jgi:hypothetical protein
MNYEELQKTTGMAFNQAFNATGDEFKNLSWLNRNKMDKTPEEHHILDVGSAEDIEAYYSRQETINDQ